MAAYGNMDKGLPGGLIGLTETHQIDSRLAKGNIPYGAPVFGTGDGEQVTRTGSALLGVAGRTAKDTQEWKDGDSVNVVRTGKVWGVAGAALSAGLLSALIAGPCQFVRHAQLQADPHDVSLVHVDKGRLNSKLTAGALPDRLVHRIVEDR